MTANLHNSVDVLARTAWGENRSGGTEGMQSVMNAILNRVAHPGWWGDSIISVCLKPWQFSSWNAHDPNRAKLLSVMVDDPQFAEATTLAGRAVMEHLPDLTNGADSYYATSMETPPAWADKAVFTVEIAGQRFYRTVTA
jgi:N-acetylmuramoyl-L-alanine amidase